MNSLSSIALSGMNAAQTQLGVAANNLANSQTPAYSAETATLQSQAGGGVNASVGSTSTTPSMETDVVQQLQAKNAFLANLAVFKTSNQLAGALLNVQA